MQPNKSFNTNEPYLEYYNFLMTQNNSDIPQVISHSYGDDEQVSVLCLPLKTAESTLETQSSSRDRYREHC